MLHVACTHQKGYVFAVVFEGLVKTNRIANTLIESIESINCRELSPADAVDGRPKRGMARSCGRVCLVASQLMNALCSWNRLREVLPYASSKLNYANNVLIEFKNSQAQ